MLSIISHLGTTSPVDVPFQPHGRAPSEGHHQRVYLFGSAEKLVWPNTRGVETENQGDGQPVSIYHTFTHCWKNGYP